LEHIHNKGLVYRDIKPENFLLSASCVLAESDMNWPTPVYYNHNSPPPSPPSSSNCRHVINTCWGNQTSLYAVDFGLATWWRNPKTKKPYPECKKPIKYKTGTARYASLNVHRGRTHARRDDMESLGYLLLDLLLAGELPWSGVTARTSKAGWDRLKTIKEEILLEDMCLGLPHGIMDFIDYTRRLRFSDRPDYDYLRRLLRGCIEVGPFSKLVAPHPHTRMIPSPPRYDLKRRSSQNSYKRSNKSCYNDEDVFVMDDLAQALPPVNNNNNTTPQHANNNNNNRGGKRHYSKKYASSSSQHKHYYPKRSYYPQNNRYHIGWNTSKQHPQQDQQWEHHYNSKNSLQTP
jgi:serine/threonine protein kinase